MTLTLDDLNNLFIYSFIIYYKNRTRSTNMTSHIKTYKWSQ